MGKYSASSSLLCSVFVASALCSLVWDHLTFLNLISCVYLLVCVLVGALAVQQVQESTRPVAVLRRATVCLLQTLVMVTGAHSDSLQPGAVRTVCGLLRSLADSGSKIVHDTSAGLWLLCGCSG